MIRLPEKLIQFGFFLLYNHLAFAYDFIAWSVSFGQWANWRRTALPYLQPGPTLELAYGTGGFYVDMAMAGFEPIGIDLSPFMARLTARRLRRQGLPGTILRAKAQELPFPDGYFVNAVATFPTNYIFEEETILEINRVLAADSEIPSRLVIVMQGQLEGNTWLKRLIEWLYQITGQREITITDPLSRFKEAGFEANWELGRFQSAAASLIIARKSC